MDTSSYRDIHTFMGNTSWLHGFMAAYALWGGLVLLAGMLIGAWWSARRRPDGRSAVVASVVTGIATLVAVGLNAQVISPLIGRVRPCNALAHMTTLLPCNPDYSMPSDHAIIGGAFAAGFWIIDRRDTTVAAAGLLSRVRRGALPLRCPGGAPRWCADHVGDLPTLSPPHHTGDRVAEQISLVPTRRTDP